MISTTTVLFTVKENCQHFKDITGRNPTIEISPAEVEKGIDHDIELRGLKISMHMQSSLVSHGCRH